MSDLPLPVGMTTSASRPSSTRLDRLPLTGLEVSVAEALREDLTRASQGRVL